MKAFVGQCEALVNQASEMQVVVLRHAAADDDEMLAKVAVGELASQGQIEAVVEHFRPEAAAGDVGAMKAMFYALMTVGGREASAEGMRLLERLAEGGDAWAVAMRERARAYEREHARVGSATGFGPGFERATAAFAAANGEQNECFAGYCDPEGPRDARGGVHRPHHRHRRRRARDHGAVRRGKSDRCDWLKRNRRADGGFVG